MLFHEKKYQNKIYGRGLVDETVLIMSDES